MRPNPTSPTGLRVTLPARATARAGRRTTAFLVVVAIVTLFTTPDRSALAQTPCETGAAVPDPERAHQRNLVERCDILLSVMDRLRGRAPLNWSVQRDIAAWEGVTLSSAGQHITQLDLSAKGLSGTLPPELGGFDRLQLVVMNDNSLHGPIPDTWRGMERLTLLALTDNGLSGGLPPALASLTGLSHLYLARNNLSGGIPPGLGNAAKLQDLDLSSNRLTGPIPPQVRNLTSLNNLHLHGNRLTGPLHIGSHRTNISMDYQENADWVVASIKPQGVSEQVAWNISGPDARMFTITDNGTLSSNRAADYEAPHDHNRDRVFQFQVTGQAQGPSLAYTFAVHVTNENETPTITPQWSPKYPENHHRPIGYFNAQDPERSHIRWSLAGPDADRATVGDSGARTALTFKTPPNFEAPTDRNHDNVYEFEVRASDGVNSARAAVQVAVTNSADEPPELTGPGSFEYQENRTLPIHTFTAIDPDRMDQITWSLSGPDAGRLEIRPNGQLWFKQPPDFEAPRDRDLNNRYQVTIEAVDPSGTSFLNVEVAVTDTTELANLREVDVSKETGISEGHQGAAVIFKMGDQGVDSQKAEWSLTGEDASKFEITPSGGAAELQFLTPPDFEHPHDQDADNQYLLVVKAVASNGSRVTWDVTIAVKDVNELPAITGPSNVTFPENLSINVATYTARDPEENPIKWTVSEGDAGLFAVDGEGRLSFRRLPDFEAPADADGDNIYNLKVLAYDGTNQAEQPVAVEVIDTDDAPEISMVIHHPDGGDSAVAAFSADDPEGKSSEWAIAGPDSRRFRINEAGSLAFRSPPSYSRPLDQDRDGKYEITLTASAGNAPVSFTVTVVVIQREETPPADLRSSNGAAPGSVVLERATKPESNVYPPTPAAPTSRSATAPVPASTATPRPGSETTSPPSKTGPEKDPEVNDSTAEAGGSVLIELLVIFGILAGICLLVLIVTKLTGLGGQGLKVLMSVMMVVLVAILLLLLAIKGLTMWFS